MYICGIDLLGAIPATKLAIILLICIVRHFHTAPKARKI